MFNVWKEILRNIEFPFSFVMMFIMHYLFVYVGHEFMLFFIASISWFGYKNFRIVKAFLEKNRTLVKERGLDHIKRSAIAIVFYETLGINFLFIVTFYNKNFILFLLIAVTLLTILANKLEFFGSPKNSGKSEDD